MRLMKLTLAAVAGGVAANYLLNKARTSGAGQGGDDSTGSDGAGASSARSSSSGSSASGQRGLGSSTWMPSDSGSGSGSDLDSLNEGERLRAARPANSLAGSGGQSLDPLQSNARDGEYATSTGLADFSRGA